MPRPKEPKARDRNRTKDRAEHHAELLAGLANQNGSTHALTDDAVDSFTIEEFRRRNRLSVAMFYKVPALMPASFKIGKRRLISREAAARWRAEREAASAAE